ncbi:MAG: simple sugar transport system substrate-binding protein [Trebonia sp.]|jgi:simple sugar transport system substrate-binding protein|nr:simple sugar transport system substrate-binding protein [Trebonia sp.]MDX6418984.1 simple sugar transport system substrate-binding protein [Trebonia sp.]MEA2667460.1 simple sugar transport system substrate-binding protein [Chloroflexota bacterium]
MKKIDPKVDEAIQTLNMKDGPSRRKLLAGTGLVSAAGAATALLSACTSASSSGTVKITESGAAAVAGNFPKTPAWKFWFVNHADTNEFFTPTKYGYADAAALLGLPTPNWGGDPNSNEANMINYMKSAMSAKADGIALAAISDTAFTGTVSQAMDSGIPVLTYNADGSYKNGVPSIGTNRLAYVGQALYISGQVMGEQIKTLVPGGGRIAIFIATPGTGNIQPRYDGAKAALGSAYQIDEIATTTVDGTELSDEKSYLLGHKSTLKGAFAVDSGSTANLAAALAGSGVTVPAGGFDTDPRTLNALQAGKVNFTIFQDPYQQGFLPVLYMYLYNLSGGQLAPPDTDTGLTVLNKGNVGQFLKNSRFQGGASAQAYLPRPAGAISQPMATTST